MNDYDHGPIDVERAQRLPLFCVNDWSSWSFLLKINTTGAASRNLLSSRNFALKRKRVLQTRQCVAMAQRIINNYDALCAPRVITHVRTSNISMIVTIILVMIDGVSINRIVNNVSCV